VLQKILQGLVKEANRKPFDLKGSGIQVSEKTHMAVSIVQAPLLPFLIFKIGTLK
jgi:hypothetical protein